MKKHDLLPATMNLWAIQDGGRLDCLENGYPRCFSTRARAKAACILKGEKPVAVTVTVTKRARKTKGSK